MFNNLTPHEFISGFIGNVLSRKKNDQDGSLCCVLCNTMLSELLEALAVLVWTLVSVVLLTLHDKHNMRTLSVLYINIKHCILQKTNM
jgi:hypothetical protein